MTLTRFNRRAHQGDGVVTAIERPPRRLVMLQRWMSSAGFPVHTVEGTDIFALRGVRSAARRSALDHHRQSPYEVLGSVPSRLERRTPFATSTAWSICAWLATNPLNWTTALLVSTLTSKPFSSGA